MQSPSATFVPRLGNAGPIARRAAKRMLDIAPIRGVDSLAYMILGKPKAGRVETVRVNRDGAWQELDMADAIGRQLYLDTYESMLRDRIRGLIRPNDVVLDVGANCGPYSLLAAALGARVGAFEPVPATVARLQRSLDLNPSLGPGVEVQAVAVSSEAGELVVGSADLREFSGDASVYRADEGGDLARVPADTLDRLVPDKFSGPIRLLKIDVEGHEPAVLRGAQDTLRRVEYLVIEISDAHLRAAGSNAQSVVDMLRDAGFTAVAGYGPRHGLWPYSEPTTVPTVIPHGYDETVLWRSADVV